MSLILQQPDWSRSNVLPSGFQGKRQAPGESVACLRLRGGRLRSTRSYIRR